MDANRTRYSGLIALFLLVTAAALYADDKTRIWGKVVTFDGRAAPKEQLYIVPAGCCQECSCKKDEVYYCCRNSKLLCCAGKMLPAMTNEAGEFKVDVGSGKYDIFHSHIGGAKLASDLEGTKQPKAPAKFILPKTSSKHRRFRKD